MTYPEDMTQLTQHCQQNANNHHLLLVELTNSLSHFGNDRFQSSGRHYKCIFGQCDSWAAGSDLFSFPWQGSGLSPLPSLHSGIPGGLTGHLLK